MISQILGNKEKTSYGDGPPRAWPVRGTHQFCTSKTSFPCQLSNHSGLTSGYRRLVSPSYLGCPHPNVVHTNRMLMYVLINDVIGKEKQGLLTAYVLVHSA